MKRITLVLVVLALGAMLWAAGNAAVAPREVASSKPQAPSLGAEAITIPQMLSYQGKLTDTLGGPVPNGSYPIMLLLYTVPSGGSPFWTETQSVTVKNGLFSVLLGSVTPIGSLPSAGAVYLGMTVSGGPELTPRVRIVSAAYAYLTEQAANADLLQGKDTTGFVRAGQMGSVTSAMVVDGTVAAADLGQMGASSDQVMKWTGSAWEARNDSVGQSSGGTVTSVSQTTGVVCSPNPIITTGTVGFDQTYGDGRYVNVSGDSMTSRLAAAGEIRSHVRGTFGANCINQGASSFAAGQSCKTYADFCNVGGGYLNQAGEPSSSDSCATVCGGYYNFNGGRFTFIGGGRRNSCSYNRGVICGGDSNQVNGSAGVVCGGVGNKANQNGMVGGGGGNFASNSYAAVLGGADNAASGLYSTVGGGWADTSDASYSFTVGNSSFVPSGYNNSAAFNGQTASASSQTRVGVLSKASGTFTIDHPLDPSGKILNHYFIEGPEMLNIYRGSVVLDASGRAEVDLPPYFGALNRNPQVVLTGIGSSDVYLVEEVSGNRFTVGGKPGTKVNWIATGERKDVSAEVTRRMMPVEQPKTGSLAGRMLDDEFLSGCMDQLVREGKAQGIDFRTTAGRARYQKMKQSVEQR